MTPATARPACKSDGFTIPRGGDELAARGLPTARALSGRVPSRSVALVPVRIALTRQLPVRHIDHLRKREWSVGSISRHLNLPPQDVADYLGVRWSLDEEAPL